MFKSAKTKKILSFFISGMMLIVFVVPLFSLAQGSGSGGTQNTNTSLNIKIANPFKANTMQELIKSIVNDILIPIGGVVAVMAIMWAGFKYVTAGGDTTKIKEARSALTWAVVGAAILLGAWVISEAIQKTVNQLKITS